MISPDAARNVVGNVISFGLFLSPVPTFWRIIKNKDVVEFKSDPYLATLLNCMLWVFYDILCVIFGSAMYASPLTIMACVPLLVRLVAAVMLLVLWMLHQFLSVRSASPRISLRGYSQVEPTKLPGLFKS